MKNRIAAAGFWRIWKGKNEPIQMIDQQIAELGDWRGEMLARVRELIHAAVPDITEEWKWGTAVYTKRDWFAQLVHQGSCQDKFLQRRRPGRSQKAFQCGLDAKYYARLISSRGPAAGGSFARSDPGAVAYNLSGGKGAKYERNTCVGRYP